MQLYFDGNTQMMIEPTLGQQIKIMDDVDKHNEADSLVEGQKFVMDEAVKTFARQIFYLTKCQTKNAASSILNETYSSDEHQDWQFRYVAQVSEFIRLPSVVAIQVKSWQLSQVGAILRTRTRLPRLPEQHTLEVRHTCRLLSTTYIIHCGLNYLLVQGLKLLRECWNYYDDVGLRCGSRKVSLSLFFWFLSVAAYGSS